MMVHQLHIPDLCDVVVNCYLDPCLLSTCPQNPTAICVSDYCGGCNARWYYGGSDITMSCDTTPTPTTP